MRLRPRSLYGRLLALSALMTGLALVVAAFAIGHVLERFVTEAIDDRLGDKLALIGRGVRKDGSLDTAYIERFDSVVARDAEWRIDAPGGSVGTASINGYPGISYYNDQSLPPIARLRRSRHNGIRLLIDGADAPWPFDARLADGEIVHGRVDMAPTDRGLAFFAVAVPRAMIDRPTRAILVPLAVSLLILGAALTVATLLQLRIGLRPLKTMRASLVAIRAGRAEHVPPGQPAELAPLAAELNALIAQNAAALAQARGHVANLAHGLKTPLATLALELQGRDPDGRLSAEVERIARAVRHHLGRARAAAPGGAARPATALAPAVEGLVAALARIHAERGITATRAVPPVLSVAVDAQDLDELVGNLLDNAWRWARTSVEVTAISEGATVRLSIADDGPGIPPAARAAALAPGRRLDEAGDGHGFGLSIARELAELHGGFLALETAAAGGLDAVVVLPAGGTTT